MCVRGNGTNNANLNTVIRTDVCILWYFGLQNYFLWAFAFFFLRNALPLCVYWKSVISELIVGSRLCFGRSQRIIIMKMMKKKKEKKYTLWWYTQKNTGGDNGRVRLFPFYPRDCSGLAGPWIPADIIAKVAYCTNVNQNAR